MPVYEYQCTECGQIEEAFQKISDPPREICAHCKGGLKKLISQSSFQLKGSGWYVTDYGGSKSKPGAGAKTDTSNSTKAKKDNSTSTKKTVDSKS